MMTAEKQQNIVLGDLLEGVPAEQAAIPVSGLALDSRLVQPGDVFLAVRGHYRDGSEFIAQASERGAVAVIADAPCDIAAWTLPVIAVSRLGQQLSEIAGRFYDHPSRALSLVGVTGTNGKSSCVLLMAQLLEHLGEPCGVMGTLGQGRFGQLSDTENTTPDPVSVQRQLRNWLDAGAQWAAMEVSSHGLAQGRVSALRFRAAIFTNLSQDHLDYHGDMETYGAEKSRLFTLPDLGLTVLNRDDPFSEKLRAATRAPVLDYSLQDSTASVSASDIHFSADGARARVTTPWGNLQLHSPLLGDFNLANLLAVITALGGLGVDLRAIESAVAALKPIPGRMERLQARDGLTAVIDYAHSPDALKKALESLRRHCDGRLWCVFGCGGERDTGKRPQMGAIAEKLADHVIVTSDNPRGEDPQAIADAIIAGMASSPERVELSRRAAVDYAISHAAPDDVVLVAGKGHEDYQELAGVRLPFSDLECVRLALAGRALK